MNPPSSQEVYHFRGRNLSPQSPIPVHIPEARNIPVLENQNDPVFNLMSTHMPSHTLPGHGVPAQTTDCDQDSSVSQPRQSKKNMPLVNDSQKEENGLGQKSEDCIKTMPDEPQVPSDVTETSAIICSSPTTIDAPSQNRTSPLDHTPGYPGSIRSEEEDVAPEKQISHHMAPSNVGKSPEAALMTRMDMSIAEAGINVDSSAVDYQALLDNIVSTSSLGPKNDGAEPGASQALSPSSLQTPIATLPIPAGLPARPPPQEKPAIHPNYDAEQDIQTYHRQYLHSKNVPPTSDAIPSNPYHHAQSFSSQLSAPPHSVAPVFAHSVNGLHQVSRHHQDLHDHHKGDLGRSSRRHYYSGDREPLRTQEIEIAYDEFLRAEADYTSQGQWERFPHGSRLFVGNLFTEKIDKRDVFYIFHKYGTLAQISLKSAYGFVQFLDVQDCSRAIQCEQGLQIRGRKINLEVSKPQKNTRNAATAIAAGESLRAVYSKRSRSPNYFHGERARELSDGLVSNRYHHGPGFGDTYVQSREDYHPQRTLSPRDDRRLDNLHNGPQRRLDTYTGRSRSRSPYSRYPASRARSPPWTEKSMVDPAQDQSKQLSGSAPDVQIILAEEIDRTFVDYVQQSFRDRGLRCEILQVPRVDLSVLIRRQILEGVQAVVKIFHWSQISGKIPLQVFNRSQGLENVQFDEYDNLDAGIAAELVVRAKITHVAPPRTRQLYHSDLPYDVSQYGQQHLTSTSQAGTDYQKRLKLPQAGGQTPVLTNMSSSLDGHDLQKLLASVSRPPQSHQVSPASLTSERNQDLSHLLSHVAHQHTPQSPLHATYTPQTGPHVPHEGLPQQLYQQESRLASGFAYSDNARPSSFQHSTGNVHVQQRETEQNNSQPQHQNIQDIMAQLARYR